jgi:hypothetical protein
MPEPLHPRRKVLAELDAHITHAKINRDRYLQDLAALPDARRTRVLLRIAEERVDRLRRSREALLEDGAR